MSERMSNEVVERLVGEHRRFLQFLEPRVGSRAVAEEILQSAFAKGIERGGELRDDESAVAWFYRLLRNAVVDHYRHRDAERRALEAHAAEAPVSIALDETALQDTVCKCVGKLAGTLKPEFAEIIERVDVQEASVPEAAAALGITANNAGVRLHRARAALRKQLENVCGTCATHGCLNCTCGSKKGGL
jgi:RNA polymerase sigma factor (sigma-70 family)